MNLLVGTLAWPRPSQGLFGPGPNLVEQAPGRAKGPAGVVNFPQSLQDGALPPGIRLRPGHVPVIQSGIPHVHHGHLLIYSSVRQQESWPWLAEGCEKTLSLVEREDPQLIAQMKSLQEEIDTMQTCSKNLMWAQDLHQNVTSLFHAVTTHEQSMASATQDFSVKISAVKTDIRRISGLEADVTLLVESLRTIEDKVDKAEKTTVQSIGDLLTNSIDRTSKLQISASENERQLILIKTKLSELTANIDRQSNKLLDLESDRAKVLKTVAFANDLKPKVYNLRKDFAYLEPMMNELTSRIGRLVEDLLERQKEIAYLYKELSNLTSAQKEVNIVNEEITQVSNLS
ncbi:inhibitor of nuclear factor kappa-B kinase-interacting protein isoform X3 [Paroedura picta]|uniref:inhibitor of nuclear factor kappa-B kinase-interacting protein isoform X3 n=1 Tax=Paroedura picta TaxID=143630 RepID=UPI004056B0C5